MSVPVFFTKEDFYGKLLPGYATIILALYFFFDLNNIYNDILASVLFIVVGPVIGYTLNFLTNFFASKWTYFWRTQKAFNYIKYLSEAAIKEEYKYLFSCNVLENDYNQFLEFLAKDLKIKWAKHVIIEGYGSASTITDGFTFNKKKKWVTSKYIKRKILVTLKLNKEKKWVTLKYIKRKTLVTIKLNKEKKRVTLKIDGDRTYKYILIEENGKLNIYDNNIENEKETYYKDYVRIRLTATERQINELDKCISEYYFGIATGTAFIVLSLCQILRLGYQPEFFPFLTFFGGMALLFQAKQALEGYKYTFDGIHNEIIGSHKSKSLDGFKMACIYPDGRLTDSCKTILSATKEPLSPEEIATASDSPLFKVRSSIRELTDAGLMEERFGKYVITSRGEEKLKK